MTTDKQLRDLPHDIYELFSSEVDHVVSEENLEILSENLKNIIRRRFRNEERGSPLRFSNLGKPDRQLWYENSEEFQREPISGKTLFKFLYGDVIEELILFLAREAGHTVSHEQHEVDVDGVKGHIDAVIDGVVVDIKSASPYSFKKFKDGSINEDDPFGYIPQLSGYANVLTPGRDAAFVAFNKVDGDVCVSTVGASVIQDHQPEPRIKHLRGVLESPDIPERCYPDEEDGKSGNRKLGINCSYCGFKDDCWPGLRTFLYSGRPRFLTKVVREPNVLEVTPDRDDNNEIPE